MHIERSLDLNIGTKFLNVNTGDLNAVLRESLGSDAIVEYMRPKGGGDKLIAFVNLPDFTFDVPELGGEHTPRIWLRNSNTGDGALTVGVGLYRALCMNGLYLGMSAFGAKMIHRDGPKAHGTLDRLPDALREGIAAITSGAALESAILALETPVPDPISVVGSLPNVGLRAKDTVVFNIINGTGRPEDNTATAWGLYQAVNEAQRRAGRSLYRNAVNDIGLLDSVMHLAQCQEAA